MNTASAFAMGLASQGNELKVFDWDKAAELILRSECRNAGAGLSGDWEWTGGAIFKDGRVVPQEDTYTFLASTWATPEIELDGRIESCYRMASECPSEWGEEYSHTYWPESALRILRGQREEVLA